MSSVPHDAAPPKPRVPAGSPWNLPNLITLLRLVLSIVLFVIMDWSVSWIAAAVVFLLAAGTDFVDGMLARKLGLVTVLGRILDPFVDKVIICGAFVFLLPHKDSGVTAWMAMIVIAREMLVTTIRSWMEQQGQDFSAAMSGKIKMLLQCAAVFVSLLSLDPGLQQTVFTPGGAAVIARDVLLWIAVASTVYSGAVYVVRAIEMSRKPV